MKKAKFLKVLSVSAVAAMMAAAMVPTTAFAANVNLPEQTVTMPDTVANAKYNVYLVAAAAHDSDNGAGMYTYTIADSFEGVDKFSVDNSGRLTYNNALLSTSTSASDVQALAKALQTASENASTVNGGADLSSGGTINLDPGYYLVTSTGTQVQAAPILVSVTNEAKKLTAKSSDITFEKNITAIDIGSLDSATENHKTAEGAVGSKVSYEIVTNFPEYDATLPDTTNITDFVITDNPSDGITIDTNTIKVLVDGKEVTGDDKYSLDTSVVGNNKGTGFKATFVDKYVINNKKKSVKITFDATINANAQSQTAVPNDATLNYGNDYTTGGGDGSMNDETDVYRTDLIIQKNDESKQPIANVGFTIYKVISEEEQIFEKVGDERTTDAQGKITITDLPAGDYIIEETSVPAGYKKADDVKLTISALKDNQKYNGTYEFVGTDVPNSNTKTIVNIKGQELPGTGGMGTTIFTIAGLGVIVIAGAMLTIYLKKRKADEE